MIKVLSHINSFLNRAFTRNTISYFHRFDFDIRSLKAITHLIVSKLLCSMVNASYVVWVGLFVS